MFDLIMMIIVVLTMTVVGNIYAKWRLKQNAKLSQIIAGSVMISIYLAVVYAIVMLLVLFYQSSSIPGYDQSVFGSSDEGSLVLTTFINIVKMSALFSVAFIIGGLVYYKFAKKPTSTPEQSTH